MYIVSLVIFMLKSIFSSLKHWLRNREKWSKEYFQMNEYFLWIIMYFLSLLVTINIYSISIFIIFLSEFSRHRAQPHTWLTLFLESPLHNSIFFAMIILYSQHLRLGLNYWILKSYVSGPVFNHFMLDHLSNLVYGAFISQMHR